MSTNLEDQLTNKTGEVRRATLYLYREGGASGVTTHTHTVVVVNVKRMSLL